MPTSGAASLAAKIQALRAERKQLEDAVAEIDAVFEQFGIQAGTVKPGKRRGRPPGRKKLGRPKGKRGRPKGSGKRGRPRGAKSGRRTASVRGKASSPKVTGAQSVLAFLSSKGKATTAEVVKHWKSEGRAGIPNPILSGLIRVKKITKAKQEGVRGSVFAPV